VKGFEKLVLINWYLQDELRVYFCIGLDTYLRFPIFESFFSPRARSF